SLPPRSHTPSQIINVRRKLSSGSLSTLKSQEVGALLLLRRHTFNYLGQKPVILYQFFVLSTQQSYRRNFLQSCCRNWIGKPKRQKRRRRCTTFSRTLSRSRKTAQNKYKYLH